MRDCQCPLLAQSRHRRVHCTCLLSRVKRTYDFGDSVLRRQYDIGTIGSLGAYQQCHVVCRDVFGSSTRKGTPMKSSIVKRSIVIDGHKTSVSLEDLFWTDLKKIALDQQASLGDLVAEIDRRRKHGNLSSAIRLFVLNHSLNQYELIAKQTTSPGVNGERGPALQP